jgi:ribosomal protein L32
MRRAASAPSFCWHCGDALKLPYYATVTDQLGHKHRVHKICTEDAENECRRITAQEVVKEVPNAEVSGAASSRPLD